MALDALLAALDKKVVSIDQCFLSNMCKGDSESRRLLDSLTKAHLAGRIICPIHYEESVFESAFFPSAFRNKVFALQNLLSDGFAFQGFTAHVRLQTLGLLTEGFYYPKLYEKRLDSKSESEYEALAKEYQAMKERYLERMANRSNYPPASYKPGINGDKLMIAIGSERAKSMIRLLVAMRDTGTLSKRYEDEWEVALSTADFLIESGVPREGICRLLDLVCHHRWETIPHLLVHTRLCAQIEFGYLSGHKKASANDFLDLSRLAVGLNEANVVLCDTAMAAIAAQAKLANEPPYVRVFSMKQQDEAAEFIENL